MPRKKIDWLTSYLIPVVVLSLIVYLTIPWIDFNDIVGDIWSIFALYGGMSPYDYGSVHLPMVHATQYFLTKIYIDFGRLLGCDVDAILNMYVVPTSQVSKILHQIGIVPVMPLNLIVLMKIVVFAIDVSVAFLLAELTRKIGLQKTNSHKYLFLLVLFNPVIFCVFFILVKLDEALSILGIVGVVYLLLDRKENSKTHTAKTFLIGILSVFPFLSKLYFPCLPLLSLLIFYKTHRCDLKDMVAMVLGASLIFIPFIPDLIKYYHLATATGLTTVLHPGFYTPFSLARLGGLSYVERVTASLGGTLSSIRPYLLLITGLYAVILSLFILRVRVNDAECYLISLLNYLIFETGIRLLLVPNVLIQYLPMPIILFTLYLLLQRKIRSRLFLIYYILAVISSIAFIIYEWYNFPLGYAIFQHRFDEELFLKKIRFSSGSYWLPSFQLMLLPSFMAGFTLWFLPLLMVTLSLPSSLRRAYRGKVDVSIKAKEPSRIYLNTVSTCLIILIIISPVYSYSFVDYTSSMPYNISTKTMIISYGSKRQLLKMPDFPSRRYTITFLPENITQHLIIHVTNVTSNKRYGTFSRSLFQFLVYVDIPSQLNRFGIRNSTSFNDSMRVSILYSDVRSDISSVVENSIKDSQIVITVGFCEYKIYTALNITVMAQNNYQVLLTQSNGWRSIVVIPYFIRVDPQKIIYNDEVLTVIDLGNKKILGILKTAMVLPSIPFTKSVSEDICRAILKILTLLNRENTYQEVIELSDLSSEITISTNVFNKTDILVIADQEPVWWLPLTYVETIKI